MKVSQIISITNGKMIIGDKNQECENFSKDTRTIKLGDTYIGLKGEKFDGSMFWEDALNNRSKCSNNTKYEYSK